MFEFGDIHRRYAVKRGAALGSHGVQDLFRVERGEWNNSRAPGVRPQNSQHAAKAVKKRHGKAEAILGGEPLRVPDPMSVVDDVVMGEHGSLGKTRGAGGVLNIDD